MDSQHHRHCGCLEEKDENWRRRHEEFEPEGEYPVRPSAQSPAASAEKRTAEGRRVRNR